MPDVIAHRRFVVASCIIYTHGDSFALLLPEHSSRDVTR